MDRVADLIALAYFLFALALGSRVWRQRQNLRGALSEDARVLVGRAAFFLLLPITVALHELGHLAIICAVGARVAEWHFFVYWGFVTPTREPPLAPIEDVAIAASGNLVSIAVGVALLVWAHRRPMGDAMNLARVELARLVLVLHLALYPLLSLAMGRFDFAIIRFRLNAMGPYWGDLFAWGYLVAAIVLWTATRSRFRAFYSRMTGA